MYVCEVRYREWTPDGVLRHAAFLRMRPDKDPKDCDRQGTTTRVDNARPRSRGAQSGGAARRPPKTEKAINFSNLKKI
jgi:bifunctional non-homologous end joining protein LigD